MTIKSECHSIDASTLVANCEEFIHELEDEEKTIPAPGGLEYQSSPKGLLSTYYAKFFPLKMILRWLSYGNERQYLSNREFSFTLCNDIYVRYQSFDSASTFAAKLQKELPIKMDIGAVYSSKPTERKSFATTNFKPLEHELVFDIDMTDYDDVRTCCQGKNVCSKCWRFIAVAVKIIQMTLKEDFGFEHVLWVFSGRRGIHCWVADHRARQLSVAGRKAVVTYLDLLKGSGREAARRLPPIQALHPSIKRSLDIINGAFPSIALQDQNFLGSRGTRDKFIASLPDENLRKMVKDLWGALDLGESKLGAEEYWLLFEKLIERLAENNQNLLGILLEQKLAYLYPRLDTNVTMQLNHLLKSPFCVHPDTGKICVTLDPSEIDKFDPSAVPTVRDVCVSGGTILEPSLTVFEAFVRRIEASKRQEITEKRRLHEVSLSF